MSGQDPDGAMVRATSWRSNTAVSIDPEPEATTSTTGVLVGEEEEEEQQPPQQEPQEQEEIAAEAAAPAAVRHSIPQAVGSGPQYKHQVRDVSQISTILLEADDQGASNNNLSQQNQQQQQQQEEEEEEEDRYEPVIIAQAKLLPDADPIEDYSNINFGGDVNQSGRSNNNNDCSNVEPKHVKDGDGTPSSNNRKHKYWIVAGIVLVVLVAVIVGIVVSLTKGDSEQDEPFVQVGPSLNGPGINAYFGTALALSETGHRMAVASPGLVWVYQYNESEGQWLMIGQPIAVAGNSDSSGSGYNNNHSSKRLDLQGDDLISIDMNAIGDKLVIGYEKDGWVQIFRYLEDTNEWITAGQRIEATEIAAEFAADGFGAENTNTAGFELERFGASVSMSAGGNIVAVGAPGREGFAGYSFVFQRELEDGNWGVLGSPILGPNSKAVTQLGRSVCLSAAGTRLALGGRTTPDTLSSASSSSKFSNVASVYEFDRFGNLTWTQVGTGIEGIHSTKETGWYVDLDASGNRMAVSNTYVNSHDHANTDPNVLVVQVYEFDNESEMWKTLGNRLHGELL